MKFKTFAQRESESVLSWYQLNVSFAEVAKKGKSFKIEPQLFTKAAFLHLCPSEKPYASAELCHVEGRHVGLISKTDCDIRRECPSQETIITK